MCTTTFSRPIIIIDRAIPTPILLWTPARVIRFTAVTAVAYNIIAVNFNTMCKSSSQGGTQIFA